MKTIASKTKIHWWEDAYGKSTCHLNSGSMMAADSYVGEVYFKDTSWYAVVKGNTVAYKTQSEARKYVECTVGGEPVNEND